MEGFRFGGEVVGGVAVCLAVAVHLNGAIAASHAIVLSKASTLLLDARSWVGTAQFHVVLVIAADIDRVLVGVFVAARDQALGTVRICKNGCRWYGGYAKGLWRGKVSWFMLPKAKEDHRRPGGLSVSKSARLRRSRP